MGTQFQNTCTPLAQGAWLLSGSGHQPPTECDICTLASIGGSNFYKCWPPETELSMEFNALTDMQLDLALRSYGLRPRARPLAIEQLKRIYTSGSTSYEQAISMWIRTRPELYSKILCAQIVSIEEIHRGLQDSQLDIPEPALKKFMEQQGIAHKKKPRR